MSQYSYGDTSIRESLWDQIQDLDPIENYVTTNSGTISVTNKIHSWNVDPIASTNSQVGVAELTETTYAATNPNIVFNTTQIIERGFRVSKTNQNSDHSAWKDEFAREQMKKMKEWGQQLEFSVVAGSLASGTGTAARTMAGFVRFASTLVTTQSLVSLSSSMFNTFLGNAWEAGTDHEVVLVGRVLKERISGFTTPSTRNIEAKTGEVVGRVDTYDSDYGIVSIIKHRYVNNFVAANSGNGLVTYIPEYVKVGFMDEPHYEERPSDGYFMSGAVVGEATVQVGNEKAVQRISGLL
jgi:hypothetical protein